MGRFCAVFLGLLASVALAAAVAYAAVGRVVLTASPEAVPPNGTTESLITVTVYDQSENPLPGQTVNFSADRGDLSAPSAVTNSQGVAQVTFTVYSSLAPDPALEGARARVTATADSVSASVYVGIFNTPHGSYAQNTNACTLCHGLHSSRSPRLLKAPVAEAVYDTYLPAVAPLCFTCHDGTGSMYNVKVQFMATSGHLTFHPVRLTGNPAVRELINCTACHNPHADARPEGGIYPRLLRQCDFTQGADCTTSGPPGVRVHQGPNFCLTCHGSLDRMWGGKPGDPGYYDYYTHTSGDHTNPYAVHYDTSRSLLLPPSGTRVTCVRCHDQHAARDRWLLPRSGLLNDQGNPANGEEEVCLSCHNSPEVSIHGVNIKEKFCQNVPCAESAYDEWGRTGPSRHDLFSNGQTGSGKTGARVECISCHGPHTVSAVSLADDPTSTVCDLADPDNTKHYFCQGSGPGLPGQPPFSTGDIVGFCLRCHDGDPPQEVSRYAGNASRTRVVPYTILFPSWLFTTNPGGFNKNSFLQTGHYSQGVRCTNCHDPHGSLNPRNLILAEDTEAANGYCLSCHDGSYPGAPEVKTDFLKRVPGSAHPTLVVSARHSDRENYQNLPLSERHAECADCHDPHSARPYSGGNGIPRSAPGVPGPNFNVSGVLPDWTGVPSGGTPSFTFRNPATYLYEICFKCHTSYSWGSQTPPVVPSETTGVPQPDKAREFNGQNPAFHPVVVQGRNAGIKPGAFNPSAGVGADSQIYCTDCHGRDEADANTTTRPYGPHGSAHKFILKGPATRIGSGGGGMGGGGGGVTANEICFRCHSYGVYYNGALDGTGQHYTRYVGAAMGGGGGMGGGACPQDAQGRISLHCFHVQVQGRPCLACHAVHGTMSSQASSTPPWMSVTLSPGDASDCSTPENCWRGTKRLLAFRGGGTNVFTDRPEGIYRVDWNLADQNGDGLPDNWDGAVANNQPNRCYSRCHMMNPRQWTPAYDYVPPRDGYGAGDF